MNDLTVVMAHGGWADGSSWSRVIAGLGAHGIKSVAAPLPLTDLADDVAALTRSIERISGQVILAGHAYAGAVIGLARPERVRALVYINAFAPDDGETLTDLFFPEPHAKAPKLAPDSDDLLWLPDEAFPEAFAPNASSDDHTVLAAIQRPLRFSCMTVPTAGPVLWKTVPAWYFIAEEDRMIVAATQQFMAERMKATIRSHPVDHAPIVTAPEFVVEIILEAAQAVAAKEMV